MAGRHLDRIAIKGYKSIFSCELELGALNVLVGPNGAGKTNLISALGLLGSIVNEDLQLTVARAGGASSILHHGPNATRALTLHTYFGQNQYEASFIVGARDDLIFEQELCYFQGLSYSSPWNIVVGRGTHESGLREAARNQEVARYCLEAMESWRVFHFHDTSSAAPMKQKQSVNDNRILRRDASNLAPFLYRIRESDPNAYERIKDAVRLVAPFFSDFSLSPDRINPEIIQLEWKQKDTDAYFNAHALSDGTLRFICLATLLLQPEPPSLIIVDEPELGLHPFAITQLADMFRATSRLSQLVVSTQSVTLLNQLSAGDVIITEQGPDGTTFDRPEWSELQAWLEEYAIGELWEKNVIGGRPR